MALQGGGGKIPGKEEYSGRRRATTRKSGFKSHADSTGGEFQQIAVEGHTLAKNQSISLVFSIPTSTTGALLAYGGWFAYSGSLEVISSNGSGHFNLKQFGSPNWSKLGSIWKSTKGARETVTVQFTAKSSVKIAFWNVLCGVISHSHLDALNTQTDARTIRLLANMHAFSPEAHFFGVKGSVRPSVAFASILKTSRPFTLTLKSCNRCARFLPINIGAGNERNHLSFSNHCVAAHRRPCRHTGFGILKNAYTGTTLFLEYGFQLECRYCKKFEVNAAHNPQRTAAQMKEDAARRRGFELLLESLYGGSPQLLFRHKTGKELADEIWGKFSRQCFKCKRPLATASKMHLDHTRPLALLWPLDESATALCKTCNSEKRDRPPALFYDGNELRALSKITGIPLPTLKDPSPNFAVLIQLSARLSWFFDTFLTSAEMVKVRDGKVTGELLVKALHKVDSLRDAAAQLNLQSLYDARRSRK